MVNHKVFFNVIYFIFSYIYVILYIIFYTFTVQFILKLKSNELHQNEIPLTYEGETIGA